MFCIPFCPIEVSVSDIEISYSIVGKDFIYDLEEDNALETVLADLDEEIGEVDDCNEDSLETALADLEEEAVEVVNYDEDVLEAALADLDEEAIEVVEYNEDAVETVLEEDTIEV